LHAWGDNALLDDAALIVTELATNAVLHASSGFTVDVSSSPHAVRVAVHDASPARPERRDASPVATSGRGLGIVAALANRWDVESVDAGKTVWAELHRRR
jgi:anti-sigma regulatory factor (Ser/Thr protein kinase)